MSSAPPVKRQPPTEEQRAVIECWGRGMAVMAGAGCGKTTTLVNKCLALLERKPEARFAAVSFTERSASDLRVKLSQRIIEQRAGSSGDANVSVSRDANTSDDPLSAHWVMTIHGLCGSIIREFPREAGFDGEETMLSESESQLLWERAIEDLWMDEIPEDIRALVDTLLSRESRESLAGLLRRIRSLRSFGVMESLGAQADPSARALEYVGRFVLDRFDRLKRRQGALDFDDLERGADLALRDRRVQQYYQNRFDLVLVDEFQDTNPVQARILWRFIRPDASNLCVVGDPKQSIYRFRDADVSVFEEFCSKLPEKKSLTWNFRSRPGVIDFTNAACAPAFAVAKMNYEALIPKRDQGEKYEAVLRLDEAGPRELARWIREERDRGVPLHEMALLLRKIRGNEKWLRALTAEGISVAVGSGGLFWEDPRVRELVAFLKWWDNPGHVMSGATFLRAPWVGIEDAVIDRWLKEDPVLVAPFLASEHPLAGALKPLREQIIRPGEALMALLINDAVEQELGAPLLGLWHRVEQLSSRGLDFHSVVGELVLAVEESRRERDVPPPRNQGQLSVLTIHGSKGLEFPHVILLDLGEKQRAADTPLLYWDREKGVFLGGRDVEGERTHKKDPVEKGWKAIEQAKNLAESMRLFYVALTRAQERLILVCPPLKPKPKNESAKAPKKATAKPSGEEDGAVDKEKVYGADHWRGWVDATGVETVTRRFESAAGELNGADQLPVFVPSGARPPVTRAPTRMIRPRHSVTEWNLLSRCPRAYEWTYLRKPVGIPPADDKAAAKAKRPVWVELDFETGELSQRELGTRVHACLQTSDWDGLRALESEAGKRFKAEPVIEWATRSPLMKGARRIWSELPFEVVIAGEVLVGAMDRVILAEDGSYILVDFKVTSARKPDEVLLERYRTQMMLYAHAIRMLEPGARVSGWIVNISPQGVQEVPVPEAADGAPARASELERLVVLAREIVAGNSGEPAPGSLCEDCEFGPICPAKFLTL